MRQAAERAGAARIVTTEKDAVKLSGLVSSPSLLEGEGRVRGDFWAVRINPVWIEGREEWERMVQLNNGAHPLVELHPRTNDRMAVVLEEILQDKIYLDTSGNMHTISSDYTSGLTGV